METREQRRVRLIERYVERTASIENDESWLDIHTAIKLAEELADSVIDATPQDVPDTQLLLAEKFMDAFWDLCKEARDLIDGQPISWRARVDWKQKLEDLNRQFRQDYLGLGETDL